MPVSVAARVNRSARARELHKQHPYFTPQDIAKLTGMPLKNVKSALEKGDMNDKPKSRSVDARRT